MQNFTKYLRDTAAELKQVSWPTRKQAMLYTALVIAISIIVALFVAAFDFLFNGAIDFLVNKF